MTAAARALARRAAFGLTAAALFAGSFWPTFRWMVERFDAPDSFYSHGWLIPLASGWLIWRRRARLRTCRLEESLAGLALLVPALLLQVAAVRWDLHFVSGFALVGALWGFLWTCWGWPALWALRLPMLFLLFMVPLPGVLLLTASFHMKLLAAAMATLTLRLLGTHAVQAGSVIQLPGVSVLVDDACSGLRSLLSLVALSTLWASCLPASAGRWPRLALVASAVPVALAANAVRITVLVLTAAVYGPAAAEGFVHYGSGLVVFGVALLALSGLSRWMTRLIPSPSVLSRSA